MHPVPRVLAFRVVEHLDGIERVLPCIFAGPVGSAPDPFTFDQVEEAFSGRFVVAVAPAALGGDAVLRGD